MNRKDNVLNLGLLYMVLFEISKQQFYFEYFNF